MSIITRGLGSSSVVVRGYGGKLLGLVGDLLDYVYMTLGIAQRAERALGIMQMVASAVGVRQESASSLVIEASPDAAVVTDSLLEFNLGIVQDTSIAVGVRQTVGIDATVTQEVAELLTQTLDY